MMAVSISVPPGGSAETLDARAVLRSPVEGACVGRVHLPAALCARGIGGPTVVSVRADGLRDLSVHAATMAELLEKPNASQIVRAADGPAICSVDEALENSAASEGRDGRVHFLAPIDLQVIKACGVTFPASVYERLVEERARGNPDDAAGARQTVDRILVKLRRGLVPGSEEAAAAKAQLVEANLWSQYLEVALGPHAEVFTKAPVLAAVGTGATVGVRDDSEWSNSEPEIVLVMNSANQIVGATLGNDLNLRDFEGRSALLLGVAKDNNGSCALGPWIRLFEDSPDGLSVEQLMASTISLELEGVDGYSFTATGSMTELARHPRQLVDQVAEHHQYPDGYVLFLGTPFAPTDDRADAGMGFTHRVGDRVTIRNEHLGALTNWVELTSRTPPWTIGIGWLWDNLSRRGRGQ